MQDCPECFGKRSDCGNLPQCDTCEFIESCRYCAKDNSRSGGYGHASYERYSYSREVAAQPQPQAQSQPDTPISDADARRIMEFLLDIDNYTAELLSEVLHGNCNTASDLARKFGVSRQAIHRKIVDCCTANPDLRKLFISRLYRCRRIMRDSKRLSEQAQRKINPNQLEFNF